MSHLRPEFAEHASIDAVRTQYERAQAQADLWSDRARDLFLLLREREDQASLEDALPRRHGRLRAIDGLDLEADA